MFIEDGENQVFIRREKDIAPPKWSRFQNKKRGKKQKSLLRFCFFRNPWQFSGGAKCIVVYQISRFPFLFVASTFVMLINAVGDWSHSNCRARLVDPTSRGYRWTTNGSLKSVTRISLLRTRFRSENRINITSQIGKFVEVSLLLADVPVQALSQRIEPVGDLVLGANGRHWVDGCCNPQTGEYEKHQLATKKKLNNSDEQIEL